MTCNQENNHLSCCSNKGFSRGFIYGIFPHFPCFIFIISSILGVTFSASIFRQILTNRYFFYWLIIFSFILASISALICLKREKKLSWQGIKKRRKYLLTLFGTTMGINLLLFMIVFPLAANLIGRNIGSNGNSIILRVDIPCPGHASLVINELKNLDGVLNIKFNFPNVFEINFNSELISREKILSLDIFKNFQAEIIK